MGKAWLALLALVCWTIAPAPSVAQEANERKPPAGVLLIRLENEPITPITVRFLRRAINQAEEQHRQCLIIQLDTPGGLVDATRDIVKDILSSHVPVVVYVAPSGARAASAGVFITLASHVAAMAPGTHIGAAHPVQIGGLPSGPPQTPERAPSTDDQTKAAEKAEEKSPPRSPMQEKIVQDTEAWARSLAELRGRNAEWAAEAVSKSRSLTAAEALEQKVIDLIAADVDELLDKIDGRKVELASGAVTLQTRNASVHHFEMWWGDRLLAELSDPNVAFLLLMFGFYGILFELYTPGWGVAGTLGAICLLLAFFGLAVLPINYIGLALIAAALALFVAEAFVTSFGALTLGGVLCLVLGGLMLVESPPGFLRVSLSVLVPVALATALITVFLVSNIVKTYRRQVRTGDEGLMGIETRAEEDFTDSAGEYRGTVRVHGEFWNAVSDAPVAAGARLIVRQRKGLSLVVRPASQSAADAENNVQSRAES